MSYGIGIDIDDVLLDTAEEIVNLVGLYYNETFKLDKITEFNIDKCLGIDNGITLDAIDKTIKRTDLKIKDGAVDVITKVAVQHPIHFVTHRPVNVMSETNTILDNILPHESRILHMVPQEVGKHHTIKDNNIKIHIEDRAKNAVDVHDNVEDCIVLLFDRPWNRYLRCTSIGTERIIRVHDWHTIGLCFATKFFLDVLEGMVKI